MNTYSKLVADTQVLRHVRESKDGRTSFFARSLEAHCDASPHLSDDEYERHHTHSDGETIRERFASLLAACNQIDPRGAIYPTYIR